MITDILTTDSDIKLHSIKMKSIIIGSSNTKRFYKYLEKGEREWTEVKKCTRIQTFKALMNKLEVGDTQVIFLSSIIFLVIRLVRRRIKRKLRKGLK